jgi:hypothetical protein
MTTIEDQRVYEAQQAAFEGTPLGDLTDRTSLILETREIITELPLLVGEVVVEEGRTSMTKTAAYAQPGFHRIPSRIVFAPNVMARFIAVHEVAHIVHSRSNLNTGTSHGWEYRGIFADLTAIVYGDRYGELLRDAFCEYGMSVSNPALPRTGVPIIDIDRLADMTRRWL